MRRLYEWAKPGLIILLLNSARAGVIPQDRMTLWDPGLNAVGGIPHRTAVFKTLSPTGGDDTQMIQAALDSCPGNEVVQLSEGIFRITGEGLAITKSNVVLRGNGPEATKLVKDIAEGVHFPVIIIGARWAKYTEPVNLAADGARGTRTISIASNPGYKIGEIVTINQLTDPDYTFWGEQPETTPGGPARGWFCEYDRPTGQILEITAISGSQLTFSTPLHLDFLTANQAHLIRFAGGQPDGPQVDATEYSGIEDLSVANGDGGDGGGNIHLFASAYCWVMNVESDASIGTSVNLDASFRCEVRDSYIHSTRDPNPGGAGYGTGLNMYASDNLFENNIVWNFNKMTVCRASGGGNVFGYNYFEDGYGAGYTDIVEIGAGPNHFATAHNELFEGNRAFNFQNESYWGNSIYCTIFRNHWTGLRRSAPPLHLQDGANRLAVGVHTGGWWYSFAGNVLGFSGMPLLHGIGAQGLGEFSQTHFVYQSDNLEDNSAVPMWVIDTADPLVVARTYRHGNFDFVTNSTIWDPANPDHNLPNSLYLPSKPAFFGLNSWPWVTPEDTANPVGELPAKLRFDAIMGPASGITQSPRRMPGTTLLYQNFPNPFNPSTSISYRLSTTVEVRLRVYDLLGREVALLVHGIQQSGNYTVKFDGHHLPTGTYFLRLDAGGMVQVKAMSLLK